MKRCYHCMEQYKNLKNGKCPHCGNSPNPEGYSTRFLKPGTVLQDRYMVGMSLGSGGFGITYIGWDQLLQRKIAIKEYFPYQLSYRGEDTCSIAVKTDKYAEEYDKGKKNFLREARNLASLKDIPGVVKVINYFEEFQTAYLVMEYLEGKDVKVLLEEAGGRFDYERARVITLSVLYTLRQVHERNYLHRDISPDNVFMTNHGVIKLIDFGSANALQTEEREEKSRSITLKPGYAPYEQYSNVMDQGPTTDLYAVGALLYRMITGQKPLPSVERLTKDSLIPPSEMGIEIPELAELGMMTSLNLHAKFRLQSADEFIEALDGLDFQPVQREEKVEDSSVRKKKTNWRQWKSVIAAGAVGLLAVVAVAAFMISKAGGLNKMLGESAFLPELTGYTVEEAEKQLGKNDRISKITIETKSYHFDVNKENDSIDEVFDSSGRTVNLPLELDEMTEEELAQLGIEEDEEGNYSGTLYCDLCRNDIITYQEIVNCENAYRLAEKLDKNLSPDADDDLPFTKIAGVESEDQAFYKIQCLSTDEGEINFSEMEKTPEKELKISEIKEIRYFAVPFYEWSREDLESYVKNHTKISEISSTTYIMTDEVTKQKQGDRPLLEKGRKSIFLGKEYLAIQGTGLEEGSIVSIDHLDKNDHFENDIYTAGTGTEEKNRIRFNYVSKLLSVKATTAEGVKDELIAQGIPKECIKVSTSTTEGASSEPKIEVKDKNGKVILAFLKANQKNIQITITQLIHEDSSAENDNDSGDNDSSGASGGNRKPSSSDDSDYDYDDEDYDEDWDEDYDEDWDEDYDEEWDYDEDYDEDWDEE